MLFRMASDVFVFFDTVYRSFLMNRETAVGYLNSLDRVFIFDGFANWDPQASEPVTAGRGRWWYMHQGAGFSNPS